MTLVILYTQYNWLRTDDHYRGVPVHVPVMVTMTLGYYNWTSERGPLCTHILLVSMQQKVHLPTTKSHLYMQPIWFTLIACVTHATLPHMHPVWCNAWRLCGPRAEGRDWSRQRERIHSVRDMSVYLNEWREPKKAHESTGCSTHWDQTSDKHVMCSNLWLLMNSDSGDVGDVLQKWTSDNALVFDVVPPPLPSTVIVHVGGRVPCL